MGKIKGKLCLEKSEAKRHLKLRPVRQTNGNIADSSICDSVVQGKSGDVSINLPVTVI